MTTTTDSQLTATKSNDSCLPVVQYTGRVRPIVSVGSYDRGRRQFYNPYGVVVEQTTEDIYIADQCNHKVQVFSRDARFLFEFGIDKMRSPLCIAINRDRVFVTQFAGGCVLVYDLDGRFIQQIGSTGSKEGQFKQPWGIAIYNTNGDIYVCDYFNDRIQIFSNENSHKLQFGRKIVVKSPRDVQLTKDTIFVLSYKNPFLSAFDYNLTQLHYTVCDSICKQLSNPFSFIIDGNDKFIISDSNRNSIVIFDKSGHLLHTLTQSLSEPTGVCLNSNGGLIVVGYTHFLLIF